MAKRFFTTELVDDPEFIDLNPSGKALWLFLLSKCDISGVVKFSDKLASLVIGCDIPEINKNLEILVGYEWIEMMKVGKYFIIGFCDFQYGTLSEGSRPHKAVIKLLVKHDLFERVSKGYPKGIYTLKDKDKAQDKDQEQDKDSEFLIFNAACLLYPGLKRESITELADFQMGNFDWENDLPLLLPAIQKQIEWRNNSDLAWRPPWKNFKAWLSGRHWEDVLSESAEAKEKDCIECGAAYAEGHKFGMNTRTNKKEYKCKECRKGIE
jgi:hypothetical protein